MSKTRSEIENEYGPTEEVASSLAFVAIEDDDGDVWVGRDRTDEELVNAGGGIHEPTFREFVSVVHESNPDAFAEYVREETDFEEPEDPVTTPEDVADVWLRCEDKKGRTVYVPSNGDVEVEYGPFALGDHPIMVRSEWVERSDPGFCHEWYTKDLTRVDASEVPFSEVPDDD